MLRYTIDENNFGRSPMQKQGNSTREKEEMTFSMAMQSWLKEKQKDRTRPTVEHYEELLKRYIIPLIGETDVNTITDTQIHHLIASLENEELHGKKALTGTTLENLRGLTINVVRFGKSGGESASDLKTLAKIKKTPYKPLSPDEITRLIACAQLNHTPLMLGVLLALYTGIGTGELCALSWDDVNLERREIFIHHTIYRVRDDSESANKTKRIITDVRKNAIRTVSYPKQLSGYVEEFYAPGKMLLSGEREHCLDRSTLNKNMEKVFDSFGLKGITLQRVTKTYKAGLADISYLTGATNRTGASIALRKKLDEKWLIREMENDLESLRKLLGLSGSDMGKLLGLEEREYLAMEAGEDSMDWNSFLALLFFFRYNRRTEPVVKVLGLYPEALRERITIA